MLCCPRRLHIKRPSNHPPSAHCCAARQDKSLLLQLATLVLVEEGRPSRTLLHTRRRGQHEERARVQRHAEVLWRAQQHPINRGRCRGSVRGRVPSPPGFAWPGAEGEGGAAAVWEPLCGSHAGRTAASQSVQPLTRTQGARSASAVVNHGDIPCIGCLCRKARCGWSTDA